MLIGTLVNVVLKLWRGDQGIVFFLGTRWKYDLRRLSGASWVSTLICGRTRNPRTGAECSRSWSATGSTAPSPAGNPPPPTWNNQKSCLQATARLTFFKTTLTLSEADLSHLAFLKPMLACCIRTDRLSVMLIWRLLKVIIICYSLKSLVCWVYSAWN